MKDGVVVNDFVIERHSNIFQKFQYPFTRIKAKCPPITRYYISKNFGFLPRKCMPRN